MTDAEVIAAVRSHVEAMAAKNDRRAWRSHQVACRIADCARELGRLNQDAIAAAGLDAAGRAKRVAEARIAIRGGELNWEAIDLELDDRRRRHEKAFRQRLEGGKQEMLENLLYDLSRSPVPKTWWERDLPFRLRRELVAIARRSEQGLTQLIAGDYEWLRATAKERIGVDVTSGGPVADSVEAAAVPLEEKKLEDVIRYRLLSRVGLGVGAAAGMLLLGTSGIAVSAGIGALSETVLNRRVEEQKQMLAREIDRCLDRVIDAGCQGFGQRLKTMYETLARDIRTMQADWRQARLDALERLANAGREQPAPDMAPRDIPSTLRH